MAMLLTLLVWIQASQQFDVVIYGGTSAGVTAAIQAARMGYSVVLIEPTSHLGGLTTSGLGYTDTGNKAVIGGLAREFYRRVKKHYDRAESWTLQKREDYRLYRPNDDAMWTFEPKVAEAIIDAWVKEYPIQVVRNQRLDRTGTGVHRTGTRIVAITMETGLRFEGRMFIDATYEGDLMAAAGVSYTVGRESNRQTGETLNGIQKARNTHNHRFLKSVDPYVMVGQPHSGLLPGIEANPLPADGEADHRLQAYCYRMCMSNDPRNRIPFPKPEGYHERDHELLLRNFEAGDLRVPFKPDMMPNHKTDTNNNGAVSTDFIGANYSYPEASYQEREAILHRHQVYQKGLMWTLANHPRVPASVRKHMAQWGLPKDEFIQTGGWPHQIYVREARRLVGEFIVTEWECRRTKPTIDSIGMGSYNMDSHNCVRYITPAGFVQNEGDVQESPGGAYPISYRSIVPKRLQCTNLLVPVCLSSTHIAYGSIRMEPVFMILGQSAATAAGLALERNIAVQDVEYPQLKARLLRDGQVLDHTRVHHPRGLNPTELTGIVIDDEHAVRMGFDNVSSSTFPFVGAGYRHDGNDHQRAQSMTFVIPGELRGRYRILMSYSAHANRADNALVEIDTGSGEPIKRRINQQKPSKTPPFVDLGVFQLTGPARVVLRNDGANGYVVGDALQLIPMP